MDILIVWLWATWYKLLGTIMKHPIWTYPLTRALDADDHVNVAQYSVATIHTMTSVIMGSIIVATGNGDNLWWIIRFGENTSGFFIADIVHTIRNIDKAEKPWVFITHHLIFLYTFHMIIENNWKSSFYILYILECSNIFMCLWDILYTHRHPLLPHISVLFAASYIPSRCCSQWLLYKDVIPLVSVSVHLSITYIIVMVMNIGFLYTVIHRLAIIAFDGQFLKSVNE